MLVARIHRRSLCFGKANEGAVVWRAGINRILEQPARLLDHPHVLPRSRDAEQELDLAAGELRDRGTEMRHHMLVDAVDVVPEPALGVLSTEAARMEIAVQRRQMQLEELLDVQAPVFPVALEPPVLDRLRGLAAVLDAGRGFVRQLAGQLGRPALDGLGRRPFGG